MIELSPQMGQPWGRARRHSALRAFITGLVVALALPPFMLWFLLNFGDAHGGIGYFILEPLAGAYPFIAVIALPVWLAWSLTVLQMIGLSAWFARFGSLFSWYGQIFAAFILVVLLAIAGDIVYSIFELELVSKAFAWA